MPASLTGWFVPCGTGMGGGHYVAYARNPENETWYVLSFQASGNGCPERLPELGFSHRLSLS